GAGWTALGEGPRHPKEEPAGREREGRVRRGDTSRSRAGDEPGRPASPRPGMRADWDREWPSVREVLANDRHDPGPRAVAVSRRSRGGLALPTVPRAPGQWMVPTWLAGPPVAVFVLIAGLGGGVLSWWWAGDSHAAAIVTQ